METKKLVDSHLFEINDYDTEKDFRETCSWYKNKFLPSDQTSNQAYQKYINNYHKVKSLYQISKDDNNRAQLITYDTESEIENVKTLITPTKLNSNMRLSLLPNGDLFCLVRFWNHDKVFIIDSNYEVRFLSGLPVSISSPIYFNSNVYCFGGLGVYRKPTSFSMRFDLNENRWISLTPMPNTDYYCHSVIFNDNILICGYKGNLFMYSVEIDSFSTIPVSFLYASRKILINAERLYLIECSGFIYESENAYNWNKILDSIIHINCPSQVYCLYNKGEIYISVESVVKRYYKFHLKHRIMTKFL